MEQSEYQKALLRAQKENRRVRNWLISIGVFVILLIAVANINQPKPIIKQKSGSEIRNEMILKQFSRWDGSHIQLEKYIKNHMNDPDSYKHVETRYKDNGHILIVSTKFRGKNAFGATVTNYITAKVQTDGYIIEIIEE